MVVHMFKQIRKRSEGKGIVGVCLERIFRCSLDVVQDYFASMAASVRNLLERDVEFLPKCNERVTQIEHHLVCMNRRRGEAESLSAHRHGWVVDGLNIDAIVLQ